MKKVTSLLLALVMALALAVPAFAAGTEIEPAEGGKKTQDVTANYKGDSLTSTGTVYYVTIKWDPTTETTALKYTGKQATYTWNGADMKYIENEGATEAKWEGAAGYKVTVTNQSNAKVNASTSASANFGLIATASGDTNKTELVSAARTESGDEITYTQVGVKGKEDTLVVTYTYADTAKKATAPDAPTDGSNTVTVGTITVTVTHD